MPGASASDFCTIGLLVFDGVEELDFVGPYAVFTTAAKLQQEAGGAEDRVLLVAASDAAAVQCGHGMRVLPDVTFRDCPTLDVVLAPGGSGTRLEVHNDDLLDWLAQAGPNAAWATSVGTGAFLLHAAGLACGKRMATHYLSEERLAGLGVDIARGERWVRDGKVVSSQGISAGIDMALWLVGQLHSPAHANAARRFLQYDPAPPYADER